MKSLKRVSLRMVAASVAIGVGLVASASALAHHSFAGFDKGRTVTLQGTVKEWQFTNPHSWLQLLVVEDGKQVEYALEGSSVNTLVRRGWTKSTFKPGDKLTVEVYPSATAGEKSGAFLKATFEDGRTISSGITPN